MTKNTKIFVDCTFSFLAIEPKENAELREFLKKADSCRTKERVQSDFLCNIKNHLTCQNVRKKRRTQAQASLVVLNVLIWLKISKGYSF